MAGTKEKIENLKLETLLPRALGTLTFDKDQHLIDTSGAAKEFKKTHIEDFFNKCNEELGRVGYAIAHEGGTAIHAFKQEDGKVKVVYTKDEDAADAPKK